MVLVEINAKECPHDTLTQHEKETSVARRRDGVNQYRFLACRLEEIGRNLTAPIEVMDRWAL